MARSRRQVTGRLLAVLGVALTVGVVIAPGASSPARAADPTVGLGAADTFAVLGATAVTNTGATVVSGDVGVNPGSSITGFPPGIITDGTFHSTDAVSLQAQADLVVAYDDASSRTPTVLTNPDLAGLTLTAGTYSGGALELNGDLTLSGDKDSVFVFQAASTLITGSSSKVLLSGDVSSCNVFWRVPSSATLGTGSSFVGTIMAMTSVTADTGATIAGRLLARNAAVTLDTNVITRPTGCGTNNGGGGTGGGGTGSGGGTPVVDTGAGTVPTPVDATKQTLAETGIDSQGGTIAAIALLGVGLFLVRGARQKSRARS